MHACMHVYVCMHACTSACMYTCIKMTFCHIETVTVTRFSVHVQGIAHAKMQESTDACILKARVHNATSCNGTRPSFLACLLPDMANCTYFANMPANAEAQIPQSYDIPETNLLSVCLSIYLSLSLSFTHTHKHFQPHTHTHTYILIYTHSAKSYDHTHTHTHIQQIPTTTNTYTCTIHSRVHAR